VQGDFTMMAFLSLAFGLLLGLWWMFFLPAYLGANGGAWWWALAWGLVAAPLSRPVLFYNNLRSRISLGGSLRFLAFQLVGALPFGAICVGIYFLAKWLWY
jgi:hypothetical protein